MSQNNPMNKTAIKLQMYLNTYTGNMQYFLILYQFESLLRVFLYLEYPSTFS